MSIIEVQFDGSVRMPGSARMTNVLRVSEDTKIGASILVDTLEEDEVGVIATKTIEKDDKRTTYRKRYPWVSVSEVSYQPVVVKLAAIESDSSHSRKTEAKKP